MLSNRLQLLARAPRRNPCAYISRWSEVTKADAYDSSTALSYMKHRAVLGGVEMERVISNWYHGRITSMMVPEDDASQSTAAGACAGVRILDAGCGVGSHLEYLAKRFPLASFVGMDQSEAMIDVARANQTSAQVKLETGDILHDLKRYESNSFDVVILSQVLHHLEEPVRDSYKRVLDECYRVLTDDNDGGLLIVVYTNLKQRTQSYWQFKLFPQDVWMRLTSAADRWSCFDFTLQHPQTLCNAAILAGFKSQDMIVPDNSHWRVNDTVDSMKLQLTEINENAEKNREWKLTEGCFNYMSADEIKQFDVNLRALCQDPKQLERYVESVCANRAYHGEATVHAFVKVADADEKQVWFDHHDFEGSTPRAMDEPVNLVRPQLTSIEFGTAALAIEPVRDDGSGFGAVLRNIDLSDEQCVRQMHDALFEHSLLIIPQSEVCFSPRSHLKIASIFGEIEEYHPINPKHYLMPILQLLPTCGKMDFGPDSFLWHTDMTWREVPSACGLLCAMVVPPYDGDTCVLSTNLIYNELDESLKRKLLNMSGFNDLEAGYARVNRTNVKAEKLHGGEQFRQDRYTAVHPCVIEHPVTKRPHLFCNSNFTQHLTSNDGSMSDEQCQEVMQEVFRVVDDMQSNRHIRFKWQEGEVGSMLIWDNIATQHYAPNNYDNHFRLMHRAVVAGHLKPEAYNPTK